MTGGPTGTGWTKLVQELNITFGDATKRRSFADHFKTKHGPNGDGGAGFTKYEFGRFVDKHGDLLKNDRERGQFLIDSGTRHWEEESHKVLEKIIKHSLTHNDAGGAPKKITFTLNQVASATQAKIETFDVAIPNSDIVLMTPNVQDTAIAAANEFRVLIKCPPPSPREATP